jgi:hypothetical protein
LARYSRRWRLYRNSLHGLGNVDHWAVSDACRVLGERHQQHSGATERETSHAQYVCDDLGIVGVSLDVSADHERRLDRDVGNPRGELLPDGHLGSAGDLADVGHGGGARGYGLSGCAGQLLYDLGIVGVSLDVSADHERRLDRNLADVLARLLPDGD